MSQSENWLECSNIVLLMTVKAIVYGLMLTYRVNRGQSLTLSLSIITTRYISSLISHLKGQRKMALTH